MTYAQDITRHFHGDWHGSYGLVPTPGHSKRDRGTKVEDGADGGVVFHSFNGGDWRQLKDECRRIGLLPEHEQPARADWRETGCYEYHAADATLLYRTVRKEKQGEPKRFVAQRPDGRGGWLSKLGDVARVPYRLPELLAADPAEPVYFVEGERKADKITSWGMVATAIAFGAKGWRDDYAQHLAGRTVVILPDNDEPGREFANKVRDALEGVASTVCTLELPGLPPKGDIINWAGQGGSAHELRELTDKALRAPVATFPIADLTAWAQIDPTPKAFAMAGVIPAGEVTLFTGNGGTNKSTFGLQLCACSAAGFPMLGTAVAPGPALYVTAEDEDRENHWRLRKIAGAIGTSLQRLAGKLHVVSLRGRLNNELATFDADGRLRTAPAYQLLRGTIQATGAKLIVLDNVAHLFIGNENDRGQVTGFVNLLYQLCRDFGATLVLVAHQNKVGDTYSGSTAWLNAVRSQIVLSRPEGNPDPDARLLTLGKANYARPDQQLPFRWHDFALIRDEDLPEDKRAELAATSQAAADNAAFLACLAARNAQRRAVSEKVSPTYAPKVFADMAEAKGTSKKRLEQAMDRLFRLGAIERAHLWNGDDRKPVHGLRETAGEGKSACGQHCAGDVQATAGDLTRETVPNTYTIPKGISGAAHEAAAPFREEGGRDLSTPINFSAFDRPRANGRIILAPGETGDEPIPGWEDL